MNRRIPTSLAILIIILVIAAIIGVSLWFCSKEKKESVLQEEIDTKLTLEELKNAEYFAVEYNERIQLKDGYYFKQWQPDSASGLSVEIYDDKIAFGDLDNDGKEDAAVILTTSGGGSGSFRSLVIMLNRNGKPWYLTEKSLGDRVVINHITVESGVITLNIIVHAPGDGLCCPSLEKTSKFRLFNNQLIQDETANWQTYRNEEYGFQIKYPEEGILSEKRLSLSSDSYTPETTLTRRYLDILGEKKSKEACFQGGEEAQIDNIEFKKETYSIFQEGYYLNGVKYFSFYKDNCITLDFVLESIPPEDEYVGRDYNREKESEVFNQILSTFRFISDENPINVLYPNGGEKLETGNIYTITWDSNNNIKNIIIALMEGNSKCYLINKSIDASLGKYNWTINNTADYIGLNNLRVVLYDAAYCGYVDQDTGVECAKDELNHGDASDNYFSITE